MTSIGETFRLRSWLFAPGDSERKMGKAAAGTADVVVLDLEDAVAEDAKPRSRAMISAFLAAQPKEGRTRLWVRVNPLDSPHTLADLAAVIPARPGGIMLPKSRGRQDVDLLDHYLSALEVSAGIEQGSTKVIVIVTETAEVSPASEMGPAARHDLGTTGPGYVSIMVWAERCRQLGAGRGAGGGGRSRLRR